MAAAAAAATATVEAVARLRAKDHGATKEEEEWEEAFPYIKQFLMDDHITCMWELMYVKAYGGLHIMLALSRAIWLVHSLGASDRVLTILNYCVDVWRPIIMRELSYTRWYGGLQSDYREIQAIRKYYDDARGDRELPKLVLEIHEKAFVSSLSTFTEDITVEVVSRMNAVFERRRHLAATTHAELELIRKYAMRSIRAFQSIEALKLTAKTTTTGRRKLLSDIEVLEKELLDSQVLRDKHIATLAHVRETVEHDGEKFRHWLQEQVDRVLFGGMGMVTTKCGCVVPIFCVPIHEDEDNSLMLPELELDPHGWLCGCVYRKAREDFFAGL